MQAAIPSLFSAIRFVAYIRQQVKDRNIASGAQRRCEENQRC